MINVKSIHAGHKSDIRGLPKETEVGGSGVTRDIGKSLHELPSDKAFSTGVSVSEKLKLEKQTAKSTNDWVRDNVASDAVDEEKKVRKVSDSTASTGGEKGHDGWQHGSGIFGP